MNRNFLMTLILLTCLSGPVVLSADQSPFRANHGGEKTIVLPRPAPTEILGTLGYYRWRYDDFMARHPDLHEPDPMHIPDYYLAYGEKYVIRFSNDLFPKLSDKGRQWLVKARLNLQLAIEARRTSAPVSFGRLEENPPEFRKFAFETHVSSYMDAGLADLSLPDLIKIAATPELKDILSKDGRTQIFAIARRLGHTYVKRIFALIRHIQTLAVQALRDGDHSSALQVLAFVEDLSPADKAIIRLITADYKSLEQAIRFQAAHDSDDKSWNQLLERIQALQKENK